MPADLLSLLRTFTAREKIALPPASLTVPEIDAYPAFGKYLDELAKDSKPERVAEDLFVALARDIARLKSIPQVNVGDGFVDFLVGGEEQGAGGVVVELKPLFTKYHDQELRRTPFHFRKLRNFEIVFPPLKNIIVTRRNSHPGAGCSQTEIKIHARFS